jgi:hypothetical protein
MSEKQKILVIVSHRAPEHASPDQLADAAREWLIFADSVKASTKLPTKGGTQLGANVWLLEADGALHSILEMKALAERQRLVCSAFLVPGDVVELSAAPPRTASVQPLNF